MSDKRILLIDDDHDLADLLSAYLSANHFTVDCCFDGQSGLKKAFSHEYDLILLDVMMPKLNGFEVLKALGSQFKTPVLMLTAKGDNNDRVLGLELGADDYLAKPFHHQELLARINAILRRIAITKEHQGEQTQEQLLQANGIVLNHATRQVTCQENLLELTSTEYHVLTLLMQQQGNIVSKEVLSEQVLGRKLAMFDRSIDVHVSNIRRKILPFSQEEKIKTVRGAGYIFLPGESQ
ncbi:response regulator transcription factor [Litorilituus sediminis]|uniref:Response regulator transcription factor n=1 Tax=Litorilituus sediminis TaxID=718192 RepID=A0A4P6P594_9GAMM|nr:response regulator transcription factor [Litorilituus sediminis]QBG36653.1 response regulator transcription factor [Litorilituus sediminis]